MDITYCNETCPIRKAAQAVFLEQNNSVFEAASAFTNFIANCLKVCPFKTNYKKT